MSDRVLTFCDHFASFTIKIFDKSALLRHCSPAKRSVVLCLNLAIILITWMADSIFLSCWPQFKISIGPSGSSPPPEIEDINTSYIYDTNLAEAIEPHAPLTRQFQDSQAKHHNQLLRLFYNLYLACFIVSTLCIPLHLATHSFALWRQTWRQPLVLILEIITLSVQFCLPPIIAVGFFSAAGICPTEVDDGYGVFPCEWQILAFSIVHSAAIIWQGAKMMYIGLCCCCCSGIFATVWPCYDYIRSNQPAYVDRGATTTLAGKVMSFMPPESDRGNWLNGIKWCLVTSWTFPVVVVTVVCCMSLIAMIILGDNFLYSG